MKTLLKKVGGYEELLSALTEWRCVPRHTGDKSPAELFLGRRPGGSLPTFQPKQQWDSKMGNPRFLKGEIVRIQDPIKRLWNKTGEIIELRNTGRSYVINVDGKSVVRNQRFLKLLWEWEVQGVKQSRVVIISHV